MMKYLLGLCLIACVGCQTMQPEPKLRDQVSGTGELRLMVKFEHVRSSDVRVSIDGDYVGKYAPPPNYGHMTYELPAGLRTIRVEATCKEKKAISEEQVLILGGDRYQIVEVYLNLE